MILVIIFSSRGRALTFRSIGCMGFRPSIIARPLHRLHRHFPYEGTGSGGPSSFVTLNNV